MRGLCRPVRTSRDRDHGSSPAWQRTTGWRRSGRQRSAAVPCNPGSRMTGCSRARGVGDGRSQVTSPLQLVMVGDASGQQPRLPGLDVLPAGAAFPSLEERSATRRVAAKAS